MTRENKLALVVGFGLILFVGILISDHFSIARQQQSADMSSKFAISDPLSSQRGVSGYVDLNPAPPIAPPINEPKPAAGTDVIPRTPSAGAGSLVNDLPRPEHHNGINDAGLPQTNSTDTQLAQSEPQGNSGREPDVIPMAGPETHTEIAKVDPPAAAPNVRFHDVKPKETLFAICKQHYGDASLNKALAKYNKIDDPTSVKVGRRLMIPSAEELGGRAVVAQNAPPARSTSPAPSANTPPAGLPIKVVSETASKGKTPAAVTTVRTYTVKPGDSLTAIAQKQMGSKAKWRKLADLNSGVIDDEDNIPVGTVLRLQ
jgi:nucleoid-associated protein YgaU